MIDFERIQETKLQIGRSDALRRLAARPARASTAANSPAARKALTLYGDQAVGQLEKFSSAATARSSNT
ncbi:MAG: hypothetical protein ACLVJK_07230 [Alistipes putredinis]